MDEYDQAVPEHIEAMNKRNIILGRISALLASSSAKAKFISNL